MAVAVFEIYDGDTEQMQTLKMKTKAGFEQGLQHYFAREFPEASVCFKKVLTINPDDKTAK
jgi:hypothetical protein